MVPPKPRPLAARGVMVSSTAPAATEQEEEFMEVAGTAEEEQKQLEQKSDTSYLLSCTSSLLYPPLSSVSLAMLRNKNIPRPQSRFKDMVDNSNSPFIPLISHKPNALKPLPEGGGEGGWCRTVVCDLVSSFSTAAATSSLNAASSHREHQTMVQLIGTISPSIPV